MANKRKPTELKVITGSAKHHPERVNKKEPKPRKGAPGMPSWLLREAKAEWRRVVPELERLGVVTKVDRVVLACYCQLWGRIHQLERKGGAGATAAMFAQTRLYAVELGLTPSSRGGVEANEPAAPPGAFAGLKAL